MHPVGSPLPPPFRNGKDHDRRVQRGRPAPCTRRAGDDAEGEGPQLLPTPQRAREHLIQSPS